MLLTRVLESIHQKNRGRIDVTTSGGNSGILNEYLNLFVTTYRSVQFCNGQLPHGLTVSHEWEEHKGTGL